MTTDEKILDAMKKTAVAAEQRTVAHFAVTGTDSPDQLGILALFVTCPDEFVEPLREFMETTLRVFIGKVVGVAI